MEVMPGQLVVIKDFSLVKRVRSNEEHYTSLGQLGMVIRRSRFVGDDDIQPGYVVLFSNDLRQYHVGASSILTLDQVSDPGYRINMLFGRLRGYG